MSALAGVCPLGPWESVQAFLSEGLGHPRSRLKRFELPKRFTSSRELQLPLDLLNYGMVAPVYEGPPIPLLHHGPDFIAVDKPAGIHGHPLRYGERDNVLAWLRSQSNSELWAPLSVSAGDHERGLLYRLDQGTSGVLVLAKRQEVLEAVRSNFAHAAKEKIYVALAQGQLRHKGHIYHRLVASGPGGQRQKAWPANSGEESAAVLEILEAHYQTRGDYTRVSIRLVTGQRHQIRAQLAGLGHPYWGTRITAGGRPSAFTSMRIVIRFRPRSSEYPWKHLFHSEGLRGWG